MYSGIFIAKYVKSMASKEHNSSMSMSQMELLRTEYKIYGILQSIVIPRLKIDH